MHPVAMYSTGILCHDIRSIAPQAATSDQARVPASGMATMARERLPVGAERDGNGSGHDGTP